MIPPLLWRRPADILTHMAPRHTRPTVAITSTQSAVRVPRKRIVELVGLLARQEDARLTHVDIAVVAAAEMAELNRRYLNHVGATDVLSFDMSDEHTDGLIAQIVVCGDIAAAEGPNHDNSAARELLLYVTHGLLHLMGYDDTTPPLAAKMHARAEQILAEAHPPAKRRAASRRR